MDLAGGSGNAMRVKDSSNYNVITIAAVRNDVEAVKLAVSLGSDPRAITSPYDGTALIAAAHLGHAEVVRALIDAGTPLDHVLGILVLLVQVRLPGIHLAQLRVIYLRVQQRRLDGLRLIIIPIIIGPNPD